jgi:hypothetical protein
VTTLLVIVVLSMIVVAFLGSMGVERAVARSASNILQAKLLADAAADESLRRLLATTNGGPLASVWDRDASGNPYLYLAARVVRGSHVVTTRLPVFSTEAGNAGFFENLSAVQISTNPASVADLDVYGQPVTRAVAAARDLTTAINAASASRTNGMVGLMNGSSPLPIPVNWTYFRDVSGRVVGRYAFWTDDECGKLDLRFAGQAANASGTHSRADGADPSELSLRVLTNAPVGATPAEIANLLALRNLTNGISDSTMVRYPLASGAAAVEATTWQRIRPHVTVHSLHDDRSADGKRRLDLNAAVTSTNSPARIATETLAIRDAITNSLPDFGLRYYSADAGAVSAPGPAEQSAYVTKLAANIRDAIDADSVATVIRSDGTAYSGNSPDFIPYEAVSSDLPIAFGKEAGPFLSEYFRVVRVISPVSSTTPTDVTIRFAHYIELHNPTGRDIGFSDLGPDPFVMLSRRGTWNNSLPAGSPSVLRPADIKIRLPADFLIPAGGFAVLTTDGPPWRDSQTGYMGSDANRYVITPGTGPGQWELVNTAGAAVPTGTEFEDYTVSVAALTDDLYSLQESTNASATYPDQRERLIFGNRDGLIDFTLRIYANPGGMSIGRNAKNPVWTSTFPSDPKTDENNTAGSRDTEPRFTRGDVLSNSEVARIGTGTSACWKAGGSAYGNTLYAAPGSDGGPQQTLGGTNYNTSQTVQTGVARWRQWLREYTSDPAGNHFVANRNMRSPGDLGSVCDPARHDINGYRSQGATLRIGHSDAPTNSRITNASDAAKPDYANWLGGRGSDDTTSTNYVRNAFLLADVFRTDDRTAGRLNPNSMVRDPAGIAFQAALDAFRFSSSPTNQASAALSGLDLNATNTVAALGSFAANPTNGFIVSPGDLSRSRVFSGATNALAGVPMLGVSDAGREEFFRRSAGLLTTHSLAFTVYIRAQAGSFVRGASGADRFVVKANTEREMTVQLRPVYDPADDPLVPTRPVTWNVLYPRTLNH